MFYTNYFIIIYPIDIYWFSEFSELEIMLNTRELDSYRELYKHTYEEMNMNACRKRVKKMKKKKKSDK